MQSASTRKKIPLAGAHSGGRLAYCGEKSRRYLTACETAGLGHTVSLCPPTADIPGLCSGRQDQTSASSASRVTVTRRRHQCIIGAVLVGSCWFLFSPVAAVAVGHLTVALADPQSLAVLVVMAAPLGTPLHLSWVYRRPTPPARCSWRCPGRDHAACTGHLGVARIGCVGLSCRAPGSCHRSIPRPPLRATHTFRATRLLPSHSRYDIGHATSTTESASGK